MSCSGYFETLRRKTEQESFKNQVLQEIQEKKELLKRKLESLMVQGDFHRANQIEAKLLKLEKAAEPMKKLLEAAT